MADAIMVNSYSSSLPATSTRRFTYPSSWAKPSTKAAESFLLPTFLPLVVRKFAANPRSIPQAKVLPRQEIDSLFDALLHLRMYLYDDLRPEMPRGEKDRKYIEAVRDIFFRFQRRVRELHELFFLNSWNEKAKKFPIKPSTV